MSVKRTAMVKGIRAVAVLKMKKSIVSHRCLEVSLVVIRHTLSMGYIVPLQLW